MFCLKLVLTFFLLAGIQINASEIAFAAPVAKLTSPVFANEALAASAPAFFKNIPVVPAAPVSAPLLATATIGYRTVIPQNVPPFASQVSFVNRALSGYFAAPLTAALPAPVSTPLISPYIAGAIATPLASPLLRSPLTYASASPLFAPLPLVRAAIPAPIGLRAAAIPLQTKAFFGPTAVPAESPSNEVATKLNPIEEPASETAPQLEEDDNTQNVRDALESSKENPLDDFIPEEPIASDNHDAEEHSSH